MSDRADADDADAVLLHGRAALRNGNEAAAIPLVAEASRRHPDHARLAELLGLLHRGLDELEPAIAAFDRAAALAPDDLGIAHGRARMHLEAGRPAAALFERALALAPRDDRIRFGRISAILAEQGVAAASAALERAGRGDAGLGGGSGPPRQSALQSGAGESFTAAIGERCGGAPSP